MADRVVFPDARAVFFDAGMTLIGPRKSIPQLCSEAARTLGYFVSPDDVEVCLQDANAFYQEAIRLDPHLWARESSIQSMWHRYYSLIFRNLGMDGEAEQAAEAVYRMFNQVDQWTLFPDVMPTLGELKCRGYKVGVISDWGLGLVDNLLLPLGLGEYLDTVVVSARVGAAKPSWDLFNAALMRAGVTPDQAVHVGDSYINDVLGARSAGIHPLLIDRLGSLDHWLLDCHRLGSLTEILDMVP